MRKMQRQAARELLRGHNLKAAQANREAAEAVCGLVNLGIARIRDGVIELASAEKARRFLAN